MKKRVPDGVISKKKSDLAKSYNKQVGSKFLVQKTRLRVNWEREVRRIWVVHPPT